MTRESVARTERDGSAIGSDARAAFDTDWRHVARLATDAGVAPGDPSRQSLEAARAANWSYNMFWNTCLPAIGRVHETMLDGPAGGFRVRLLYPLVAANHAPLPVLFYFHGGGFAMNGLDTHERVMRLLARRSGAVVVGVGYHLAPEHRYPCQLDEATLALDWLIAEAPTFGLDKARIGVAGDSAGATLALSLMMHLRDQGRGDAVKLGLLFYGMYSADYDTDSHRQYGIPPFGLTTEKVEWFWRAYLPDDAARTDPLAVPLLGDVKGLPRIVLAAAGLDSLRDDTLRLADRLAHAGVDHSLVVHEGLPHSFLQQSAFVAASEQALSRGAEQVAEYLKITEKVR